MTTIKQIFGRKYGSTQNIGFLLYNPDTNKNYSVAESNDFFTNFGNTFTLEMNNIANQYIGVLIQVSLRISQKDNGSYSINTYIKTIPNNNTINTNIKTAIENWLNNNIVDKYRQ